MDKVTFRSGDIILFEGIYGCTTDACPHQLWGVAGRRLPMLQCGHDTDWRLIRRRQEHWW